MTRIPSLLPMAVTGAAATIGLLAACAMGPTDPGPITAERLACVSEWAALPLPDAEVPEVRTAPLLTIRAKFAAAHGPGGTESSRVRDVRGLYDPATATIWVPTEAVDAVDLEHAELAAWMADHAGVAPERWTNYKRTAYKRSRVYWPPTRLGGCSA